MRFAGRRRRFSSWFGIVVGVRLLALVGAAARGAAIATVQSNTFNLTVRDQDGQQATQVTSITIN